MMKYKGSFLVIILPFSIFCMNQDTEKYKEMYNEFKAAAMQKLTEEEKQAIRTDAYKVDRAKGVAALHSFAWHVVNFAYEKYSENLMGFDLSKESTHYAKYMISLRDASLGLGPIEIVDEFTARTYAVSLLNEEEQKSLQCNEYRADKDKARRTLARYAQLTAEELEKKNLLPCPRQEYERNFIQEKVKELDAMWLSSSKS
jgi:hypothetical protein